MGRKMGEKLNRKRQSFATKPSNSGTLRKARSLIFEILEKFDNWGGFQEKRDQTPKNRSFAVTYHENVP